uniref:MHC class II beta chain N-terminal domain-containing protein n=1 Tax=Cyanoderma ruficeps TaxID=181631 RepID=A0A8C3QL00_9PASS
MPPGPSLNSRASPQPIRESTGIIKPIRAYGADDSPVARQTQRPDSSPGLHPPRPRPRPQRPPPWEFGEGGGVRTCPALPMGRVAAAGARLAALGAPLAGGAELSGPPREGREDMVQSGRHFRNGTDRLRFVDRNIYNREQLLPWGKVATSWNSDPEWREHRRAAVDRPCRHNYELSSPFLSAEVSVGQRVSPRSSPGCLLCSLMDSYPSQIQLRWFQGQQELSGHVVATDVFPNVDWTYQLLVTPTWGHLQLPGGAAPEPALELLLDATHSKMLMGIGGFVFLALELCFYSHKKVRGVLGVVSLLPQSLCAPPWVSQPSVTPLSLPTELLSHRQL